MEEESTKFGRRVVGALQVIVSLTTWVPFFWYIGYLRDKSFGGSTPGFWEVALGEKAAYVFLFLVGWSGIAYVSYTLNQKNR